MDSFEKKKAIVNEVEYDIPEGIEQVTADGIFMVDFGLIQLADDTNANFFNPRHLGSFQYEDTDGKTKTFRGVGFDKESMTELLSDIANNGLNYPFLTRWVHSTSKDENGNVIKDENGEVRSIKVQIYDAERRYRCIERMRDSNQNVWSEALQRFAPAKEVYAKIPCRIKVMSDDEAMTRACRVTETSVEWGDAAIARLIKLEYQRGKTDEQICAMLNRGPQYIAETMALNELDEVCFNYLLTRKINREVAKKLLKIKDVAQRQQKCEEAYEDAVLHHAETVEVAEVQAEKAETKEDLARAELELAKMKNDSPELITELEKKVEEATIKAKERKQNKASSARPMAKSKNLRNVGGGNHKPVTTAKVNKTLRLLKELVDKGDETYGSTTILKMIIASLEALLRGDDICEAIKKAS